MAGAIRVGRLHPTKLMLTCWLGMTRQRSTVDQATDAVFAALANPERRRMLDLLRDRPGLHIAALGTHFDMSDVAVLKHVRVLESAGLVITERTGRERRLYFNVMPIQAIYDRWTDEFGAFWAGHINEIRSRVEARGQSKGQRRA